jgi:type II secretory pathway component PulM
VADSLKREREDKDIATAGTTTNPGNNRRPPKKRTLAQKWMAVSLNNKLIVIFSGVTMLATIMYTVVALWTLGEIHSSSIDTHTLAEAAKKQADKAETISDSMSKAVIAMQDNARAANLLQIDLVITLGRAVEVAS